MAKGRHVSRHPKCSCGEKIDMVKHRENEEDNRCCQYTSRHECDYCLYVYEVMRFDAVPMSREEYEKEIEI